MNELMTERAARIAWARLIEPADEDILPKVLATGHVDAIVRVRSGTLRVPPAVRRRLEEFDLDRELRATAAADARIVVPGDAEWPTGLDDLELPPHCVWVRGELDLAAAVRRSVAIVGARAATGYGTRLAAEMAGGLADRGFTIVSGAAFGIDVAAHQGALAVGGLTIAALACSVERAYPAAHLELIKQISRDGLLVSEVPPGSAPLRTRFLARNRLIAALTRGTVVVEAGMRSGSLNTANHADRCHRPVGAVPGPVTSAASAGTHEAIRNGRAVLVTDAAEVAELIGDIGVDLAPPRRGEERPEDRLSGPVRALWEALPRRQGASMESLSRASGLTLREVLAGLGELNLAGLAERWNGGWRKFEPAARSVSKTARPDDRGQAR